MEKNKQNYIKSNKNILRSFICHRLPDRTFKFKNWYFPVCSRCTGIYIGAFSYFIYVYFNFVEYTLPLIFIASLMIIPTFYDGLTQLFNFRISNNNLRFLTGLFAGVGLGILVKAIKMLIITRGGI